jgi:DNA-directed RNA polymerase specialized sigma24 family protein
LLRRRLAAPPAAPAGGVRARLAVQDHAPQRLPPPTPAPLSLDDEALPDQASPDAGLDDRLDVVRALARLAPIHREVLVLYYFDDMPTRQMAEALEIAPGTVLSRLARAREALKAALTLPGGSRPGVQPGAPAIRLRKV